VEVLLEQGPSSGVVPDLPEKRQFPAVASIGDKVFLCGGLNWSGLEATETCFYYSFVKQNWTRMNESLPSGPLSRSVGVAAYWDFYVIGGETTSKEATNAVMLLLSTLSLTF